MSGLKHRRLSMVDEWQLLNKVVPDPRDMEWLLTVAFEENVIGDVQLFMPFVLEVRPYWRIWRSSGGGGDFGSVLKLHDELYAQGGYAGMLFEEFLGRMYSQS